MAVNSKSDNPDQENQQGINFKRWTAGRKLEVVVRFLRGESLESLSREIGVAASQIEEWHQAVLRGGENALKSRTGDAQQEELDLAKKRIGELSMENELLRERSRRMSGFPGGRWKK